MQRTEANHKAQEKRPGGSVAGRLFSPQKRWLDITEAAAYIKSTVGTLYNKVHRREIPFVKLGRRVLFDVHDLDACMERNKVYPKADGMHLVGSRVGEPQFKVVEGGIFGK